MDYPEAVIEKAQKMEKLLLRNVPLRPKSPA